MAYLALCGPGRGWVTTPEQIESTLVLYDADELSLGWWEQLHRSMDEHHGPMRSLVRDCRWVICRFLCVTTSASVKSSWHYLVSAGKYFEVVELGMMATNTPEYKHASAGLLASFGFCFLFVDLLCVVGMMLQCLPGQDWPYCLEWLLHWVVSKFRSLQNLQGLCIVGRLDFEALHGL